ncbi:MAG: hypothetical protein AAGN15_18915 [Cyanobacteria bacterium J06581_3]
MTQTIPAEDYPFVEEFLTDNSGQIQRVVLQIDDYRRLIAAIEDEGLYKAMQLGREEKRLDLSAALQALADDES